MKTVILALCLFSLSFALTDKEKLAAFVGGLDFGLGATATNTVSEEGALSLIHSVNGDDENNEFKALEHELMNGLAYAPNFEIAIAHIRILSELLHTQIVDKYMAANGMTTEILYKWN